LALLDWQVADHLIDSLNADKPQLDGAYKAYVEGRGYLYRYDQTDNQVKALKAFQQAIELEPDYARAYEGLAEAQLVQYTVSRDEQWLTAMQKTIGKLEAISGPDASTHYLSAEAAMKHGRYQQAADLYQLAIEQNDRLIRAHMGLASALDKLGRPVDAERIYEQLRRMAPNNWRVISKTGIFHSQNGEYEKALSAFLKLTEISPNNHYGYRNAAGVYYVMVDIENAIRYTRLAIDQRPSDVAYSNLGTMLFYIKNYNEAVEAYQKAVALRDNQYLLWGNLADAYKLSGNEDKNPAYQRAAELAQSELKTNPKDSMARVHLAYYLANLSRLDEAMAYVNDISEGHTGLEHFVAATTHDLIGNLRLTQHHLIKAIEKKYPLEEIRQSPLLSQIRQSADWDQVVSK